MTGRNRIFTLLAALGFCTVVFGISQEALSAERVTAESCQADYQALLMEIERNRNQSIADIQSAIDDTQNQTTRVQLVQEQERAWDEEETQRNQAALLYRDCQRAAKAN